MKMLRYLRLTGQKGGPIVIGLQGGLSHVEDWKIAAPALKAAYERYGDRVRFVIAGAHFDYLKEALSAADEAGHVVWQGWRPFMAHSETVMHFDINLCPLEDTLFNRSKSAIKFLEGAAAGAASITSPTVYADCVHPGKTALVATNESEWTEALCALIERPAKRQELGRNAHLLARSEYNLETKAYLWNNAYLKAWQQHRGKVKANQANSLERSELAEMAEMAAFRGQK
jgi:glycosyltransferase involved in cell wall biosynthesis